MHGNTRRGTAQDADGRRHPRRDPAFFEVAAAEGVHPGGVHLEMTGGRHRMPRRKPKLGRKDLAAPLPHPLRPAAQRGQALDVAGAVASFSAEGRGRVRRGMSVVAEAEAGTNSRRLSVGRAAGTSSVPGDKSISHRALILGGLAGAKPGSTGLLEGEDVLAHRRRRRAFGAEVSARERESGGAGRRVAQPGGPRRLRQ
jgi:hypothetical protein